MLIAGTEHLDSHHSFIYLSIYTFVRNDVLVIFSVIMVSECSMKPEAINLSHFLSLICYLISVQGRENGAPPAPTRLARVIPC